MSRLRNWMRALTLVCVVFAATSLLSGCVTSDSSTDSTPPVPGPGDVMYMTRPTLYEVRRGALNTLIAVYTENKGGGSGTIIYSPSEMPYVEGVDTLMNVMDEVPMGYDLCAVFKTSLSSPVVGEWSGNINNVAAPEPCD